MQPADAIPVTVLTGFLGAGKTTWLNRLLSDPDLADTAVIINEFGQVPIDHLLVETASDGVIELSDGCICCTVRGELVDTLAELIDRLQTGRIGRLARVVIETTGLADPAPVLQALMAHPVLAQAFRLDGVVCLVDAFHGMATLDAYGEAVRQAAMADRLVISKSDIAGAKTAALTARLRQLNPAAEILDGQSCAAAGAALIACGLYDPAAKTAAVARWLGGSFGAGPHGHQAHGDAGYGHDDAACRHDRRIAAVSLAVDRPLPRAAVFTFLDLLDATLGDRLLRLKGIVELAEDGTRPLVLHAVQRTFHPPVRLPAWPDATRGTRLVLIAIDAAEDYLRRLIAAAVSQPAVDTPDRAAIADNPLAISGLGSLPRRVTR